MPDPRSDRDRFANIPNQSDDPVAWDPSNRSFAGPQTAGNTTDTRRVFVPRPGRPTPRPAPEPSSAHRPLAPPVADSTRIAPGRPSPAPRKTAPPPVVTAPKPARRRRRRWRRVVLAVVVVLALLTVGGVLWANSKFGQIERVQVSDLLGGGSGGTNYLIVGSDSREGVDPNGPNAGALLGEPIGGQRSDTLLILHTGGDGARMLSIPRDLFVTIAETGDQTRINAAYNGGPRRVVQTIKDNLDIPIDRYLEVDFVSFAGLVDAVGGITIDFPNPARDPNSGLIVEQSGPVRLDGSQALAYVRSRNYIETIDGRERTDPTADLGRVTRQQAFLKAVLREVGGTKNPFKLIKMTNAVVGGLKIDDGMSLLDALRLVRQMGSLDPVPEVLPTDPFRTSGGAAVLQLRDGEAQPILDQLR